DRGAQRAPEEPGLRRGQGVRAARGRGDRQERARRSALEVSRPASQPASHPVPESLVVVTGLSGSGKSYVNKCLEDMGYFCVDNPPLGLVEPLLAQITAKRVGIILDVRNPGFAARFPKLLAQLRDRVPGTRLLFLDASEESLIRRFSESRRPHPL